MRSINHSTQNPPVTPISLLAFAALLILMPLFFGELMFAALEKLHLTSEIAVVLTFGIIVGGFVNIPIKRYARDEWMVAHPLAVLGIFDLLSHMVQRRRETIIAINVGGCVIPVALAIYEIFYLGGHALLAVALASSFNVVVCYAIARPVPGVGLAMPGLVSALLAAVSASLLAPDQAPPVAFIAGVTGPLIGADLFHIGEIRHMTVGIASIGGAGTFDGIVLSGIIAAYLA